MNNLAEQIIKDLNSKSKTITVLDIGCNDGSLLGIFKNKYECTTIGVDPTEAILESGNKIDYKFNEYFSRSTAEEIKKLPLTVDVITFTNVFAHIENLPELIENLKLLITDSTKLVIENHYLGSILSKNQFDTFYHEHPRTYSLKSFEFMAQTIGLIITDVKFPSRYGGNIRVTMEKNGNKADLKSFNQLELEFISMFELLQGKYNNWRNESQVILSSLLEDGPVYGKALPGRAVMLINSLKIDSRMMPAIFEKPNSPKINNFVPGSKIKILSDNELLKINPKKMIVWSWHIIDEIVEYLDKLGYQGEIWVPLPEFKKYR
jgi:SAM-dependent methyltransferase